MADYMAGQEPAACLKCGGGLWDNRATKKNPKSPDLKCKNASCGEGYWQSKKGNGGHAAAGGSAGTYGNGSPAPTATTVAVAAPNRVATTMGSIPALDGDVIPALADEYGRCVDEVIARVVPKLRVTGYAITADTITAAAATLFIQKRRGG